MPNRDEVFSAAFYRPIVINSIRILFILIFAYIAIAIADRLIRGIRAYVVKAMLRVERSSESDIQKRAETVSGVLKKTIAAVVWVVAAMMILKEMNFDVRPLLAGAGVVGLAIGFGAQTLVKDVLGGFFMLLDDQIRIGDVVVINGTGGSVEAINLRTILLRSEDGAVHVFPNGGITKLSNLTRDYSYAVLSVSVNYRDDTDRALQVLSEIGEELRQEEPYRSKILAPLELIGVDQLGESWVVVKARLKTQAMQQWAVGREMNRRIKKKFDEAGFASTFPARTLAFDAQFPPGLRSELKEIVREVLDENKSQPA